MLFVAVVFFVELDVGLTICQLVDGLVVVAAGRILPSRVHALATRGYRDRDGFLVVELSLKLMLVRIIASTRVDGAIALDELRSFQVVVNDIVKRLKPLKAARLDELG